MAQGKTAVRKALVKIVAVKAVVFRMEEKVPGRCGAGSGPAPDG